MRRPRRIHLLLMAFTFVLFGTAFVAAECPVCFPGPDGGVRCSAGGSGGSGGGPPGGGGPTPTAVATYPPLPTPTSIPTPGATPAAQLSGIAPYTYSTSQCWQGKEIDPINVVFTGNATAQNVFNHAIDHGGWLFEDGTTQSFWQSGQCLNMDGQAASGPSFQLPGRFHMRFLSRNAGWPLGTIAVADAHHEDVTWCGHTVDHEDDNGGVSGFDMGRNDIHANWNAGGHPSTGLEFWNNRNRMMQCDQRRSSSDGFVAFIGIN